jgi:hypothetical protein
VSGEVLEDELGFLGWKHVDVIPVERRSMREKAIHAGRHRRVEAAAGAHRFLLRL